MSAVLELNSLKSLLLLLLLAYFAFDAAGYRRALNYVYSIPDILAYICT